MTPEIKARLLTFGSKYLAVPKNHWTPEDLAAVYEMHNLVFGTDKKDQGCGSCRRDTITAVRDAWTKVYRETLPGSTF